MKKSVILSVACLGLFLIFAAGRAMTQTTTPVKVKGSQVVSGVVVVDILKDGKPFRLQCNEGAYNCKAPKSGDYNLVELPEGYGMYECKNVEIYRANPDNSKDAELIGNYCLVQK